MDKAKIIKISNLLIEKIGSIPIPDFEKRDIFSAYNMTDNVIIIGPRRIGKTTLLEQVVINTKIKNDKNPDFNINKEILMLKFDSLEYASLNTEEWHETAITLRNLILENNYKMILIDEIQSMPNWSIFMKDIKDFGKDSFRVVGTGSNSNLLVKGAEHGIGRYKILFYGVLSYREAIELKGSSKNLNNDLADYINFNHFPHYDIKTYKEEVPAAIVEKSFGASKKDKTALYKLYGYISKEPGLIFNAMKVASKTSITRQYIENYLSDLQAGQMIFKLPNMTSLSQHKKIYSLVPGAFTLFNSTKEYNNLSPTEKGAHFENFVFIQLLSFTHSLHERMKWSFLREKERKAISEIDFIYDQRIAFEVKLNVPSNINKYASLLKKYNIKKFYVVTTDQDYLDQSKYMVEGIQFTIMHYSNLSKLDAFNELNKEFNY